MSSAKGHECRLQRRPRLVVVAVGRSLALDSIGKDREQHAAGSQNRADDDRGGRAETGCDHDAAQDSSEAVARVECGVVEGAGDGLVVPPRPP